MAVKKRRENNGKNNSDKKYFSISSDKKKRIAGVFLILFSLFLLLCIISYNGWDEGYVLKYSIFDTIFNPPAQMEAHNWLGRVGSHFAYFFVISMLGYFSIVFPVILFIWGLFFFKKFQFKILIHTTNFFIVSGLTLASFFGVLFKGFQIFPGGRELRGDIGEQLGGWLNGLLGSIGSILLLLFISATVLIFAFDIKIENIY